jgi:hypothetical protein
MSYFEDRITRYKKLGISETFEDVVYRLSKLFWSDLTAERDWFEEISKDLPKAKREGKVPQDLTQEQINEIVRAYREAVYRKQKEMMMKVTQKRPGRLLKEKWWRIT